MFDAPRPTRAKPARVGRPGRAEYGKRHASRSAQPATQQHHAPTEGADDAITGQSPGCHCDGEHRVAQSSADRVQAVQGGQDQGAPVQHGALGQEGDEAQAADQEHSAARESEGGSIPVAAVGEQGAPEGEQRRYDYDIHAQGREQGRAGAPKHDADAGSTGDAADAEQAVEPGHHRTASSPLHDDSLDVDHDIHGADACAEQQQRSRE